MEGSRLREFLLNCYSKWGYAHGTERLPSVLTGAKTFEPYRETNGEVEIALEEHYWGKRGSGGFSLITENKTPTLLIQFQGGELPHVSQEEVQEINDFLKESLQFLKYSRTPRVHTPTAYNDKYIYTGVAIRGWWDMQWLEIIARIGMKEEIDKARRWTGIDSSRFFYSALEYWIKLALDGQMDDILFYHRLNHQKIE